MCFKFRQIFYLFNLSEYITAGGWFRIVLCFLSIKSILYKGNQHLSNFNSIITYVIDGPSSSSCYWPIFFSLISPIPQNNLQPIHMHNVIDLIKLSVWHCQSKKSISNIFLKLYHKYALNIFERVAFEFEFKGMLECAQCYIICIIRKRP